MSKYTDDFEEAIDLTVEPWKTLAPLCWNEPSPFRLGAKAEEHGVSGNPFKKPRTRGLFEEGRQSWQHHIAGLRHNALVMWNLGAHE